MHRTTSPELIERIKSLWPHHTYSAIADATGMTRSAIAGLISRLVARGVIVRINDCERMGGGSKPQRPRVATKQRKPPAKLRESIAPPGGVLLLAATSSQCRYPLWDGDVPHEPKVCGALTAKIGGSWCKQHMAIIFSAQTLRRL